MTDRRWVWILGHAMGFLAMGCASRGVAPGGESNWVMCDTDDDCSETQSCISRRCTDANGGAGGESSGTSTTGADVGSPPVPVNNPSGDCAASGNGVRDELVSNPGDEYLPDCTLTLPREYFRVFRKEDGTAYIAPSPDGYPALYPPCHDSDHALAAIVAEYGLCERAGTEGAVLRVSSMEPADALAVAHFLHESLVFTPSAIGRNVNPHAYRDDVRALCDADEVPSTDILEQPCQAVSSEAVPGAILSYTDEEGVAVALAMNELYGISTSATEAVCDRIRTVARDAILSLVERFAGERCLTDEDCVLGNVNTRCYKSCGAAYAVVAAEQIASDVGVTEGRECLFYVDSGCEEVPVPPCEPAQVGCNEDYYCDYK